MATKFIIFTTSSPAVSLPKTVCFVSRKLLLAASKKVRAKDINTSQIFLKRANCFAREKFVKAQRYRISRYDREPGSASTYVEFDSELVEEEKLYLVTCDHIN
ncbi:MAG: hypothetical protein WD963_02165 [Candidatus Paceibacterota bacterium]